MGQSRMENPDILAKFGTQDTRSSQTKQKTQHRQLKRREAPTPQKQGLNPVC